MINMYYLPGQARGKLKAEIELQSVPQHDESFSFLNFSCSAFLSYT